MVAIKIIAQKNGCLCYILGQIKQNGIAQGFAIVLKSKFYLLALGFSVKSIVVLFQNVIGVYLKGFGDLAVYIVFKKMK